MFLGVWEVVYLLLWVFVYWSMVGLSTHVIDAFRDEVAENIITGLSRGLGIGSLLA